MGGGEEGGLQRRRWEGGSWVGLRTGAEDEMRIEGERERENHIGEA